MFKCELITVPLGDYRGMALSACRKVPNVYIRIEDHHSKGLSVKIVILAKAKDAILRFVSLYRPGILKDELSEIAQTIQEVAL